MEDADSSGPDGGHPTANAGVGDENETVNPRIRIDLKCIVNMAATILIKSAETRTNRELRNL